MNVTLTPEDLIAFEDGIAADFNAGRIRAPVHLHHGCEREIIAVFRDHVGPDDWVLCSWRSHYQCLLKGVPPDRLRADILAGRSMGLCYPEFRVYSSSIVGGTSPIAVGLAAAIRRKGAGNKVVCFLGDMTAETGIHYEARKYAAGWGLPVLWVVEDNGKSTCTPTAATWGDGRTVPAADVIYYEYQSKWPHSGAGVRVNF